MPLARGQVRIGTVILDAEPFEWPRNPWEILEIRCTERTGWATLTPSAVAALRALYNGAHGALVNTIRGLTVQYVEGTGPPDVIEVEDWRGNLGAAVFVPDTGLELEEIHGTGDEHDPLSGGYWTGTIRLVLMT